MTVIEGIKDIIRKAISWRSIIHWPHGLMCAWLIMEVHSMVGAIWFAGFMLYEITEHFRLKDGADLDIFGFLMGYIGYVVYIT